MSCRVCGGQIQGLFGLFDLVCKGLGCDALIIVKLASAKYGPLPSSFLRTGLGQNPQAGYRPIFWLQTLSFNKVL